MDFWWKYDQKKSTNGKIIHFKNLIYGHFWKIPEYHLNQLSDVLDW